MTIAAVTIALVAVALVAMLWLRAWSRPLDEADAESVDAAVRWAARVRDGLARAEADLRWVARDVRAEWDAARPAAAVGPETTAFETPSAPRSTS